jgi:hypothetical protein
VDRSAPRTDSPGKGRWIIAANRVPFAAPTWQITFDATTPIELLHDVHTELLDLYLEDRYSDRDWLFEDDTAPQEAYTPLLAWGWSHQVKIDGTQPVRHNRYRRAHLDGLGRLPQRTVLARPVLLRYTDHGCRSLHRLADLHRASPLHRGRCPLPQPPPPAVRRRGNDG